MHCFFQCHCTVPFFPLRITIMWILFRLSVFLSFRKYNSLKKKTPTLCFLLMKQCKINEFSIQVPKTILQIIFFLKWPTKSYFKVSSKTKVIVYPQCHLCHEAKYITAFKFNLSICILKGRIYCLLKLIQLE